MKKLLKPLDYIFLLRPTWFFVVWTVFLAGFFVQNKFGIAAPSTPTNNSAAAMSESPVLWVGLALTLLMGAIFILNQVMDRQSDQKNRMHLIARGQVSPRSALLEAGILILASLTMAFHVSPSIGILFLIILVTTGYVYSFKPFSWKDQPHLSLVVNVLGTFLIFGAGWIIRGGMTVDMALYAFPYACAVAAVYLCTTLPDAEGESSVQKVTFGVKYGLKITVYAGLALVVAAVILGYVLDDELIFYAAFFSVPVFSWAAIMLKLEDAHRAIKYSILLLAAALAIKYKIELNSYLYFFILLGVYLVSKFYYKFRFGIDYPRLSA
jgi:4-hydroxybenzoate polyprenyltransferase